MNFCIKFLFFLISFSFLLSSFSICFSGAIKFGRLPDLFLESLRSADALSNTSPLHALAVQRLADAFSPSPSVLHVVYTAGASYSDGTLLSIASVIRHAPQSDKSLFRFIVLTSLQDAPAFCDSWSRHVSTEIPCNIINFTSSSSLASSFSSSSSSSSSSSLRFSLSTSCLIPSHHPSLSAPMNVIALHPSDAQLRVLEKLGQVAGVRPSLLNFHNIARNWIAQLLLPFGLRKVLYLDSDTLVRAPISQLFETDFESAAVVAASRAFPQHGRRGSFDAKFNLQHPAVKKYFLSKSAVDHHQQQQQQQEEDGADAAQSPFIYNCGVLLIDLVSFCRLQVPETFEYFLDQQIKSKNGVWEGGTHQTPFVLSIPFHKVKIVDPRWNACTQSAKILHCTGTYRLRYLNLTESEF